MSKNIVKLIGISGVATSGKDTLCNMISRYLSQQNIISKRIALADNLKNDLKDFILDKFSIDITKSTPEEKSLVRPIMVSYGKIRRSISKGTHWTQKVENDLEMLIRENIIPIITDIRYMEYPEDEYYWLKNKNGILIHISRLDLNGNLIPPANIEEKENDIKLKSMADLKLIWRTEENNDALYYEHLKFLQEIYAKLNVQI
jgi:hypothetical protein